MDEKEVLRLLGNYTYNLARLEEISAEINSICIKVTPTYGNLAASAGNGFSSKVEDVGNRRHDLKQKRLMYEREVMKVQHMIERSGLDAREKKLMWWLARNGKLQAYARREHIGKSNVYKIRDRAIQKIIAQTTQNVV